jgi:hypothetical protein
MRCGALGLKDVAQRRRFRRRHERDKQFPLAFHARIEGLHRRGRHGFDAGQGRGVGTRGRFDGIARELEIRLGSRQADREIAHALRRVPLGDHGAREVERGRQ